MGPLYGVRLKADDPKSAKQTILVSAKQTILKKRVWKQTILGKADDFWAKADDFWVKADDFWVKADDFWAKADDSE